VKVAGTVRVPGDKSISHRALMLASLAEGRSRIRGLLTADDVGSTGRVLSALGVTIVRNGDVVVHGRGRRSLSRPLGDLDCGNSGTTTRLLAGVVAAHPFEARFIGDASLSRRPMRRIKAPLEAMGASVTLSASDGLPMTVRGGTLTPIRWTTETASAQTKSAVLLAALVAGVPAEVAEPFPSRDHTERMIAAMGGRVHVSNRTAIVEPVDRLSPLDIEIPADPSSASFFVALALLSDVGELILPDVNLNERRIGFLHAVRAMNGQVTWEIERESAGEPVGTIRAKASRLRGVTVTSESIPSMIDELILLGCLGARAEGETRVQGASELRVKESDRIAALVANLRAVGVDADETAELWRPSHRDGVWDPRAARPERHSHRGSELRERVLPGILE
jgi:3-phosphoshikimate 1-carboxyvinyltransferase